MIAADVSLGAGVVIHQPDLVNLYGCTIAMAPGSAPSSRFAVACSLAKTVDRHHTFICDGVDYRGRRFCAHAMFTNDLSHALSCHGSLPNGKDWTLIRTLVRAGASIAATSPCCRNYNRRARLIGAVCRECTKDSLLYKGRRQYPRASSAKSGLRNGPLMIKIGVSVRVLGAESGAQFHRVGGTPTCWHR